MKINPILRIFVLSISLICLLPSCSDQKKIKVGVSQCSSDDWREKMNREIMREAMFHDDVIVEIRSAGDSNEKQIEDIRYFADNGFDIIIAAPNEAEPVTPVIDEVMARGIPVVVFDRSVTGDNFTAFRGARNDSIGYQAAQYTKSVAGPRARILEIYGNPGSTPARFRHEGFAEGLGSMTVLASAPGYWNYEEAYAVADSLLDLYPDADVIFAHNDRMAIAAADAAEAKNLTPYIIGIDGAPEIGLTAVADGKIDATFIYPTEGYSILRTALAIVKGEPFERVSLFPATSVVDKSNADIVILQNHSLREETDKIISLKTTVDDYWQRHSVQTAFLYVVLGILILLFVFLFLFLRLYWQRQRQQKLLLEQNVELERQRDTERLLNEQLTEATQSKLMFFTNVSHDLRTPLTLIAEPVRQLEKASNLTPAQRSFVDIASKNVRILERLINQVLDFRKYESGKMKLNLSEVDFCNLVADWTNSFNAVARKRDIKLTFEACASGAAQMAVDVDKMERVFFNLLSNAFKYTPDNGYIRVSFSVSGEFCAVEVRDSGRGIPKEDMANIFEQFFQVDKVRPNGSGIGLSLAKAFVELHEGTLSVESEPGKGSLFTVRIPVRHVADRPEDVSGAISESDIAAELSKVELDMVDSAAGSEERPLVLVVDDNHDILALISALLSDTYCVIAASDGAEGVRLAAKYVPDIVLCDVMMPVMDGLECCRRIKTEKSTSHIPVVLLTACALDEQRVEGYESGADAYVAKPFSADVLKARCAALIKNRRLIRSLDGMRIIPSDLPGPDARSYPRLAEVDDEFYRRFIEVFRSRMSDSELNVDALAAQLGLGRSQFYRKIKSLTNYSPVELIRHLRLREARNLLLTTDKSVSEIAYAVGFSAPAYFAKCYRDAFGETPKETRINLTKVSGDSE